MARKASVRYWPSRKGGGFFTTLRGRQHELALGEDDSGVNGPVYRAAVAAWLALLELDRRPDEYNVRGACNVFRLYLDRHGDKRQSACFDSYLASFAQAYGDTRVRDLLPRHVTSWLESRHAWNGTTKRAAVKFLSRALNYCAREGYVTSNPLRHRIAMPKEERRGREMVLPAAVLDVIESAADDASRLFFRILRLTGARPIEMGKATAANLIRGRIVYRWNVRAGYKHKNARTQRDRVIHLPASLLPDVDRLAASRPEGTILRTKYGAKWSVDNIGRVWRDIISAPEVVTAFAACGIDRANAVPYSYRHTFITAWIDSGRSIKLVADLCGTSVAEIEKTYGHIAEETLAAAYAAFVK